MTTYDGDGEMSEQFSPVMQFEIKIISMSVLLNWPCNIVPALEDCVTVLREDGGILLSRIPCTSTVKGARITDVAIDCLGLLVLASRVAMGFDGTTDRVLRVCSSEAMPPLKEIGCLFDFPTSAAICNTKLDIDRSNNQSKHVTMSARLLITVSTNLIFNTNSLNAPIPI